MSKESFHQIAYQINFVLQKFFNSTVLLGFILIIGILLRLHDLGTESYWTDEMFTVVESQQSIYQIVTSKSLSQPPAYYIPFHFWVQIFGTGEIRTRLFSILAGVGSIALLYMIGRELFGRSVGLLGAFLIATSEFQIYFSQQTRFYSFFEFSVLLSFLFFIQAIKTSKVIHFALYSVASVLMVYSLTYGIFIFAAQNLFFILQVKKHRSVVAIWFICQALILLAFVPYFFPLIIGTGDMHETIVFQYQSGEPSASSYLDPLRSIYRFIMPARGDRSWELIVANYIVAVAFLVVGTGINAVRQGMRNLEITGKRLVAKIREIPPDLMRKLLLVSCWLLCPITLLFIFSLMIYPMYRDRYVISAAPALYLLLALGVFSVRKIVPLFVSIGALMIMVIPSLINYYKTDVNEQWPEVAQYINENSESKDVIVFAPNEGIGIEQELFYKYYQGALPGCGISANAISYYEISGELQQCISGHTRFWVIIRGEPEMIARFQAFFLGPSQTAIHLNEERKFKGLHVYLLELEK